jgi:hypothetical protein
MLRENNVIAMTFLTHTPNLFHAFNLVFFDVRKKVKPTTMDDIDDESTDAMITRLI